MEILYVYIFSNNETEKIIDGIKMMTKEKKAKAKK